MDSLNAINSLIKSTSQTMWRGMSNVWNPRTNTTRCEDCLRHESVVGKSGKALISGQSAIKLSEMLTRREVLSLLQSSQWTRLAGLFGASAVAMGAYGAHALDPKMPIEYRTVYETANKYHFFHSLALLGVPLTRRPLLVGTLMITGMCVFCGSCYVYSLTENKSVIQYTPYGGLTLILGWLAMLL